LPLKDGTGSVLASPDLDFGLDEKGAQRAFGDLQLAPVEGHAIAVAGAAFFLNALYRTEIDTRDREARAAGRNINIPEEGVGGLKNASRSNGTI
jgi:hypothetical protein